MSTAAAQESLREEDRLFLSTYYGNPGCCRYPLWSGQLAAMLFSIFATLTMWKLNPRKWLQWYLESCAAQGGKAPANITPFLPWNLTDEQRLKLGGVDAPSTLDST
jgi:hypothetical protein